MARKNWFPNPELFPAVLNGDDGPVGAWASSFDNGWRDASVTTFVTLIDDYSVTVARITGSSAHGYSIGQKVAISDSDSTPSIDGFWEVVAPVTTTSFCINLGAQVTVHGTTCRVQTLTSFANGKSEYGGGLFDFDYLSSSYEGATAWIHLGATAAGTWVKKNITDLTVASPGVFTCVGHGLETGDSVYIESCTAEVNGTRTVTRLTADTFNVGVNTTIPASSGTVHPRYVVKALVYWTGPSTSSLKVSVYQKNSSEVSVGTTGSGSVIPQGAWTWATAYGPTSIDATCDHLRFSLTLSSMLPSSNYTFQVANVIVERRNTLSGGWFDGEFGGTWVGTAHASASTQNVATISSHPASVEVGETFVIDGEDLGYAGQILFDSTDVSSAVLAWFPTQISLTTPNLALGSWDLQVTPSISGGSASVTHAFDISAGVSAAISSVTPAGDKTPGQQVVINGSEFGTNGVVTFGTTPAEVPAGGWSATAITCIVPLLVAGSVNVYVEPQGGVKSAGHAVTIAKIPIRVRRGGVAVPLPKVQVRDGGSWVNASAVSILKSGVWYPYDFSVAASPPAPPPETENDTWPTGTEVIVTTMTVAALQAVLDALPPGGTAVLLPGVYTGESTLYVPDRRCIRGAGIGKVNTSSMSVGSGTWIRAVLVWGAECHFKDFLVGFNIGKMNVPAASSRTCTHTPMNRNTAATQNASTRDYSITMINPSLGGGCRDAAFTRVRFKGGSDGGASLIYISNYKRGWVTQADGFGTADLIRNKFYDCEFERPQAPNSVGVSSTFTGGNPGSVLNGWWDCRAGGSWVYGNRFFRCHFGVKNGYYKDVNGYGIGTTVLIQPCPTGPWDEQMNGPSNNTVVFGATQKRYDHPDCGPGTDGGSNIVLWYPTSWTAYNPTGIIPAPTVDPYLICGHQCSTTGQLLPQNGKGNFNGNFNWDLIDHGCWDNHFIDCLHEYSCWIPMDICDWARNYSCHKGARLGLQSEAACEAAGWGNPPEANWDKIPLRYWNSDWSLTRNYQKGCYERARSNVGEVSRDCVMTDSYIASGTLHNQAARTPYNYNNQIVGSFNQANRPSTALFTSDWTGGSTSYTPSPFDPT